jgi:hypothetical protein
LSCFSFSFSCFSSEPDAWASRPPSGALSAVDRTSSELRPRRSGGSGPGLSRESSSSQSLSDRGFSPVFFASVLFVALSRVLIVFLLAFLLVLLARSMLSRLCHEKRPKWCFSFSAWGEGRRDRRA